MINHTHTKSINFIKVWALEYLFTKTTHLFVSWIKGHRLCREENQFLKLPQSDPCWLKHQIKMMKSMNPKAQNGVHSVIVLGYFWMTLQSNELFIVLTGNPWDPFEDPWGSRTSKTSLITIFYTQSDTWWQVTSKIFCYHGCSFDTVVTILIRSKAVRTKKL